MASESKSALELVNRNRVLRFLNTRIKELIEIYDFSRLKWDMSEDMNTIELKLIFKRRKE